MFDITTSSPEETRELAGRVLKTLSARPGKRGTATIIALEGDLGAGKTMFTKGVAEALGIDAMVTSPTFVIQKVYDLPHDAPWQRLIHIDAYRLEGKHELKGIGWHEISTDPGNIICIEWPLQVGDGVPDRAVWLEFEALDDTRRRIHGPIDLIDTHGL